MKFVFEQTFYQTFAPSLRPTQMHQTFSSNKDIEFLIDFPMFDEIEFSICAASSTCFIKHSNAQESPFILYFKMADLVTLVVLNELMDSDDEKLQ